jgi:hypothetical protein
MTKLETQTRVLGEAMIAMAEPSETVAAAINTVKEEM